jgi:hypothetical protein
MSKQSSFMVGGALISLGILSLFFTAGSALMGFNPFSLVWRLWPLIVVGAGLLFVVPPFLVRGKPGLGALFIPGLPILMTGTILLLASVINAWDIWAWLWPMELLSLAMGFVAAGIYMRVIWFIIPATIIGMNGLVFQFCAITGLWEWWSWLWVIEPLSVGLALLLANIRARTSGLTIAGVILCGFAALSLALMMTVLSGWWVVSLLGATALVLTGALVLGWGTFRHAFLPRSALE